MNMILFNTLQLNDDELKTILNGFSYKFMNDVLGLHPNSVKGDIKVSLESINEERFLKLALSPSVYERFDLFKRSFAFYCACEPNFPQNLVVKLYESKLYDVYHKDKFNKTVLDYILMEGNKERFLVLSSLK